MANQVVAIIRQQWQNRHHEDPVIRRTAAHMISTHIMLLRQLRESKQEH